MSKFRSKAMFFVLFFVLFQCLPNVSMRVNNCRIWNVTPCLTGLSLAQQLAQLDQVAPVGAFMILEHAVSG